jgi:YVTN family beta-propeller protein
VNDATVRILGPLELWLDGRMVELGGGRQRALLALLALHANEVLSLERLIDELWGEHPPATAHKVLQNAVSQLRGEIGPDRPELLVTRSPGYVLALDAEALDARRFEALAAEGARLLRDDPAGARALLGEALSLWRGEPLADFAYERFAQAEIARLQELKLAVLEDRIDADLALGRHAELVAELETLAAAHPLRERLRAQLMLALYRSGRQAEALETYRAGHRVLHEELGLEPTVALRQLEQAILRQDEALEPPARLPPRRRRRRLLVAAAAALLAAAVAAVLVPLLVLGGSGGVITVPANAVAAIDAHSNRVVAAIPVGLGPATIAAGEGGVWVVNADERTVSRINPRSRRLVRTIAIPGTDPLGGIAAGAGAVWLTAGSKELSLLRINPSYDAVDRTGMLGSLSLPTMKSPVAVGSGSVWALAGSNGTLAEIDKQTGTASRRIDVGTGPAAIAVGEHALWVACRDENVVLRADLQSGKVVWRVRVDGRPTALVIGAGAIWAATSNDAVSRIDPRSGAVTTIPIGHEPESLAVGADSVWVANGDGTVSRIDPQSRRVVATIRVGGAPEGIAIAGGAVWVSVSAAGGTLHVAVASNIDPAVFRNSGPDLSLLNATQLTLVGFPDRGGTRILPEAAAALPTVSAGGRTYTFTIRRGFRFSDGSPVTAANFEAAFLRLLDPEHWQPLPFWPDYFGDIVGVRAYMEGRAKSIAGVEAEGDTLVIRLVSPQPDLLARLAMPWVTAVPVDLVARHKVMVTPFPSAGPYVVSEFSKGSHFTLVRNRYWRRELLPWRPAIVDRIVGNSRVGFVGYGNVVGDEQAVRAVEQDTLDSTVVGPSVIGGVPPARLSALVAQYGLNKGRLLVEPGNTVWAIVFNTRSPLFGGNPKLRRAINFALDRTALVRQFGPLVGTATDQVLPPGFPGFINWDLYPLARPDLGEAQAIARGNLRGGKAVIATWVDPMGTTPESMRVAQVVKRDLARIGLKLTISPGKLTPGERWDLRIQPWYTDYADPFDILNLQFDGQHVGGSDISRFDDPVFNRRLRAAAELSGEARLHAYALLEADLLRDAPPVAPFMVGDTVLLVSPSLGCVSWNPLGVGSEDWVAECKK